MTIVITSSDEDVITLPAYLMAGLEWREGDEVKVTLDGQTVHLTRLGSFLALRGALANDEAFDKALEELEQAWNSWTIPTSA